MQSKVTLSKSVSIKESTVRDMTFIAQHLNADDLRELTCLTAEDPSDVACNHLGGYSYVAWCRGKPVAAIGLMPFMGATWSAWMFGTSDNWRAVPEMTRFARWLVGHVKSEHGVRRLEARSHVDHTKAHGWLRRAFGCGDPIEMKNFGLDGETYLLFSKDLQDVP